MNSRTIFNIHGVDYYPDVTPDELPGLYNQGYQILLFDFGNLGECCIHEFLRCDRKLVIGSYNGSGKKKKKHGQSEEDEGSVHVKERRTSFDVKI